MASLKEFPKKMFKFLNEYEAKAINDDAILNFRDGEIYPVIREDVSEVVIETGGNFQVQVPRNVGIVGTKEEIFAHIVF